MQVLNFQYKKNYLKKRLLPNNMIFFCPLFSSSSFCMCVPNSNSFFFWVGWGGRRNKFHLSFVIRVLYSASEFCLGALGCFCDLLLALIFFHHFLSLPQKPNPPQSLLLHTSIITKTSYNCKYLARTCMHDCVYVCVCVHGTFGTSFSSLVVTSIFIIIVWLVVSMM